MRIIKKNNRFLSFAKNKKFAVTCFLILSLLLVTAAAAFAATVIDQYAVSNSDNSHLLGASGPGWGQSFTGNGSSINQAWFYLARGGNPTGSVVAKIYTMTGTFGSSGKPGTLLATSNPINVSTIPSNAYSQIYFDFATPYATANGTRYVVTCEYSGGNSSNFLAIAYDSSTPSHPGNGSYKASSGWSGISTQDLVFGVLNTGTAATPPPATNPAPVANAGANQSVTVGSTVTLDGSASADADGETLTYQWSFQSKPTGSAAALSSATAVKPTFVADVAGNYVVNLVVKDANASSSPSSVTVTATTSTSTTPPPTSTPPPTQTSGSTVQVYGAPWRWQTLDNLNVGTSSSAHGTAISYRFRADHTGQVSAVQAYLNVSGAGYAAGDGGVIRIELQTDDGTANHFPSGQVLTSLQVANPQSLGVIAGYWINNRLAFNTQSTITAGQLYHIVFSNASSDPANNWYDVDNMGNFIPESPAQPGVTDTDLAVLRKPVGSNQWAWDTRVKYDSPIFTLYYTDGYSLGPSYLQVYPDSPWQVGGSTQVRETFTVTGGNKTVTQMAVATWRSSSTSGSLTLRLEQGDGTLIEQGTVAASSVSSGTYQNMKWVTYNLSTPRTLINGSTYHVVVSAPSGGPYYLLPMMKGAAYGFAGWEFSDGWIEKTTGSSWVAGVPEQGWSGKYFDMMFFLK